MKVKDQLKKWDEFILFLEQRYKEEHQVANSTARTKMMLRILAPIIMLMIPVQVILSRAHPIFVLLGTAVFWAFHQMALRSMDSLQAWRLNQISTATKEELWKLPLRISSSITTVVGKDRYWGVEFDDGPSWHAHGAEVNLNAALTLEKIGTGKVITFEDKITVDSQIHANHVGNSKYLETRATLWPAASLNAIEFAKYLQRGNTNPHDRSKLEHSLRRAIQRAVQQTGACPNLRKTLKAATLNLDDGLHQAKLTRVKVSNQPPARKPNWP